MFFCILKIIVKCLRTVIGLLAGIVLLIIALVSRNKHREILVWGPIPILSNKYWSNAMRQIGWKSLTYMLGVYSINKRDDFDKCITSNNLLGKILITTNLSNYYAFAYCLIHASVVHIPCSGGFLGGTVLEKIESSLLHFAGCKIIVLPYGADFYCYSKVLDKSLTVGLLESYPYAARNEHKISQNVSYWTRNADCMICGFQMDGIGRWDVNLFQFVVLDVNSIDPKTVYSNADGINSVVKVIHTPNHRGFKGTEFLINAVKELQNEGVKVELILLEKKSNSDVLRLLREADIMAEQFIATAYALSGIEGMATGLPVMSNLDSEVYTRAFRRYSYLNECPILSTTPETLKDNLRILITHPELRKELGMAGRKYVEKYHSYKAAQYLFSNIYDKILYGKDVDLMNLFHPLKSDYVKNNPVEHPLVENKLPKDYFSNEH